MRQSVKRTLKTRILETLVNGSTIFPDIKGVLKTHTGFIFRMHVGKMTNENGLWLHKWCFQGPMQYKRCEFCTASLFL